LLLYFLAIGNISRLLGTFYGHLVVLLSFGILLPALSEAHSQLLP
jgi:hypothetical protein